MQSFLCGVGWGLGPGRRGPQLLQGCSSMHGAKGGVGSSVSTSPALLPGTQPRLMGSCSMNSFPSNLERHQRLSC